jgi:hypothetical protein
MVCFMPGRSCGFRKKRGEGNSEVMKNMVKTCRGEKTRQQQNAAAETAHCQPYRHRRAHHALCRESVAETFCGRGAQQL